MTFDELLEAGRRMSAPEHQASLKALAGDPRFAALLAELEERALSYARAGASQTFAAHHGPMAHGMGSFHALDQFLGQLRQIVTARPKPAPPPPE